ncbi:unnamed protein product [Eruca vesicaria subsp. sativa]|uniref:NADH dehydrogenase subunit 6 n=1 Tax=Eruca vesicaria subsp. sativa TaxID=29727 RepID=A0ABC8IXL4_ERUVS|nr:unnamed protein product [Eruca vesicaria subsp. sativa]
MESQRHVEAVRSWSVLWCHLVAAVSSPFCSFIPLGLVALSGPCSGWVGVLEGLERFSFGYGSYLFFYCDGVIMVVKVMSFKEFPES